MMSEEKDISSPGYTVLEKKVLEVEARLSLMEKIVARIDGTLEQLEKRVSRIEEDIRSLRMEVREDIGRLDEKIESLRRELHEKIDSNFKWTIAIIIGGFIATIATSVILKLLLG